MRPCVKTPGKGEAVAAAEQEPQENVTGRKGDEEGLPSVLLRCPRWKHDRGPAGHEGDAEQELGPFPHPAFRNHHLCGCPGGRSHTLPSICPPGVRVRARQ